MRVRGVYTAAFKRKEVEAFEQLGASVAQVT